MKIGSEGLKSLIRKKKETKRNREKPLHPLRGLF